MLVGGERSCSPAVTHLGNPAKDPAALALGKRVVRLLWSVELWFRRRFMLGKRWRYWRLEGQCNACGACCVEPSIHVGFVTWHLPLARRLFVAWQWWVNGFECAGQDEPSHALIFHCTHFDPTAKRCDSYGSRPSMCRDYPKALLNQAWPELFPTCGHRVRQRKAEQLRQSIEATSLSSEAKAELRRKLRID
jgi:uncharacterized protein